MGARAITYDAFWWYSGVFHAWANSIHAKIYAKCTSAPMGFHKAFVGISAWDAPTPQEGWNRCSTSRAFQSINQNDILPANFTPRRAVGTIAI